MKIFGKILVTGLVSLLMSACGSLKEEPDYEKIADKITIKTADQLRQEKGLILVGIGGQMMNDIQMMSMSFHLYHEIDLEKARELVINSVNEYLKAINLSEEIRPYLHEYPFTAKNIEFWLWIYNPDRSELPTDKIYHILSANGEICYYTRGEILHQTLCEETFEEAESKINNSP